MKMRRMPSHPEFKLEGRSRHFQSFWELELTPGEETSPHSHFESEEIIYLLDGTGTITLARLERNVTAGEVVLVPPCTSHVIANRSNRLLRAITVESRFDMGEGPSVAEALGEEPKPPARESAASIDRIMQELPVDVDEATAIRKIVELFDVGGKLSEQIEEALGLDNDDGVGALSTIEKKIMRAVVEITARYRTGRDRQ
jgi:mannose-6-phosphate isomerase-like protein (cupin superfamily)